MDIDDPKFLIIYAGGSGGDFLNSVINYLYCENNKPIIISNFGKCESPGIVKRFKNSNEKALESYSDEKMLYKDLCSLIIHETLHIAKISNLFPDITLHYIDYTGYEEQVFFRYYSLLFGSEENIIKNLKNKKLKITNENWKIVGTSLWKKSLTQYKSYKANSIPLQIFFDYETFCKVIEEKFLLKPDDYVKVMFGTWQEKNKRFFKELQVV